MTGSESKTISGRPSGAGPATIVPRWEWRTFSRCLPRGAAAAPVTGEARDSSETYFLSPFSPHNVKLRGGQLDLKRLEAVDDTGLERWRPVLKTAFPIDATAVAEVCHALRVSPPYSERAAYSREDLVREIVEHIPTLRLVDVHKHRTPITVAGCSGERAVLRIGVEQWETFSFEHEDPRRVLAALRDLKLDSHANVNYPRGLKRIIGIPLGSQFPLSGES